MSLVVCEGIAGMWSYHLRDAGSKEYRGFCGAETMDRTVPVTYWGQTPKNYHIPEKWCRVCQQKALQWCKEHQPLSIADLTFFQNQPREERISNARFRLETLAGGGGGRVWLDVQVDDVMFSQCLLSQPIEVARDFIDGKLGFDNAGGFKKL